MILLERQQPTAIVYYEALIRRTNPLEANITNYIERLRRAKAGYMGELLVDREWLEATIPCPYYLLHSFEFTNSVGLTHQIDTLLVTPNFALIAEIKNISGQIHWDEFTHQFTPQQKMVLWKVFVTRSIKPNATPVTCIIYFKN